MLYGAPPSEQSDLFALGMVAYHLLTGQSAVRPDGHGEALLGRTAEEIDWTQPAPPARDDRVATAAAIPRSGAATSDGGGGGPGSAAALRQTARGQPRTRRESFLQAATLVGRERELQALKGWLKAAAQGQGCAGAAGGESGVGKSRLCEELKAQAQVRGIAVLRGQADRHRGGLDLFVPALRSLSLEVPLSDLEASVLGSLVPDLPVLIGRRISEAPRSRHQRPVCACCSRWSTSCCALISHACCCWKTSTGLAPIASSSCGDCRARCVVIRC